MTPLWILSLLAASQAVRPAAAPAQSQSVQMLIHSVAQSGRCANLAETPSQRVSTKPQIAPGLPPLLSFRYYEGRLHHRYGNVDLVLDDAGH
jgi:hypothetical protein